VADATNYFNRAANAGYPLNVRIYAPNLSLIVEDISPMTVNWAKTLPPISIKEFLLGLTKYYNLYFDLSLNKRWLTIETRDEYYLDNGLQDWSKKIDINKPREISFIKPKKAVTFTTEASETWIDSTYTASNIWGLPFGSKKVLGTWGDEELEITSPFSVITPSSSNIMALTIVGGLTAGTNGPYLQTSGGVNIPTASLYSKSSGVHELVETSKVFIGYNNGMVSLPVCASATGTIEYPFANIST
jgi:hypothetical protein